MHRMDILWIAIAITKSQPLNLFNSSMNNRLNLNVIFIYVSRYVNDTRVTLARFRLNGQ